MHTFYTKNNKHFSNIEEEIKIALDDLYSKLLNEDVRENNLFETLFYKDKFIVVIDRTDGCYPLVLYFTENKPKNLRPEAFYNSLENVKENFTPIFEKIKSNSNFNGHLHKKLKKHFNNGDKGKILGDLL